MNRTEHLLACLAEECHEVGQRALKAQRFGLLEVQPEQEKTNWQRLQDELTDLLAVMEMLEDSAGSLYCITRQGVAAKKEKVEKYMAYAESQGALVRRNR
jgi:NTP pyrophosphatase (non-canonical NTP hydrolase)